MTALRTQRRRDENTLPGDKRRTDTTLNPKKPSKRDALKPSKQNDENAPLKPRSAALDKSKSKSAPSPPKKRPLQPSTSQLKTSSGSGSRVREALASLQPQSQQPRRDSPTLNALYKTPAGQIGAAGRARVAALDRVRPVVLRGGSTGGRGNGVSGVAGAGAVPGEKGKEKRKIQVMPDELSAGFSAIDRPYSPPVRRSKKSEEMYAAAFGEGDTAFDDFEPPSPKLGGFGGDDFLFDL